MKIAVVASEAAPFVKTGGLGDVMQALPLALSKQKNTYVSLFVPYYSQIKYSGKWQTEFLGAFDVPLAWRREYVGIFRLKTRRKKLQIYFIDNEHYFNRGGIYGFADDGERYAYFSKAVLAAMNYLELQPDVVSCHDWQAALIPLLLKTEYRGCFPDAKSVFTIHNIEYQGKCNLQFNYDVLGLGAGCDEILRFDDCTNFMKSAIVMADRVTTVSETYAQELRYPYYSHGLDGVLQSRGSDFSGITNGIDVNTFNPETDPALPAHYNSETFVEGKAAVKAALQKEVGLPVKPDVPLMVMVTRLAGHKGLDLLCYIARRLIWEEDAQLLILGTGEAQYESFFRDLSNQFPDQVSAQITFNLGLAARIYAGGDIYLMPSKSEPCGLSQMNAMRYGTVPVVHATGGLKDTVPPADENGEGGLGFTFQSYNADDFFASLKRCLGLYNHNREAFRALQKRDMEKDFSWDVPAGRYMEQFRNMLSW